jgi:hypothetical protein
MNSAKKPAITALEAVKYCGTRNFAKNFACAIAEKAGIASFASAS